MEGASNANMPINSKELSNTYGSVGYADPTLKKVPGA